MNKYLKALLEALAARKLSEQAVASVKTLAEVQLEGITDETQAKLLCEQLEQMAIQLSEQLAKVPVNGPTPVIQLSMAGTDQATISAAVNKLLAERDTAAKTLAATVDGKRKLLAETIAVAEGLDDATKKALAEAAAGVITADTTDDQVKALAAMQIQNANEVATARQLAALGYVPSGSRISPSRWRVSKTERVLPRAVGQDQLRRPVASGRQARTAAVLLAGAGRVRPPARWPPGQRVQGAGARAGQYGYGQHRVAGGRATRSDSRSAVRSQRAVPGADADRLCRRGHHPDPVRTA